MERREDRLVRFIIESECSPETCTNLITFIKKSKTDIKEYLMKDVYSCIMMNCMV